MSDPIRVLIVDDEPIARLGLRDLLAGDQRIAIAGEAASGRAAVAAIIDDAPDIVLLDVQMPGLDGFAVIEAVRADLDEALPEIIFVTAHDEHALRAFDARALDYVLKPLDPARLRQALDRAIGRVEQNRATAAARRLLEAAAGARDTLHPSARERGEPVSASLSRVAVSNGGKTTLIRTDEIDWIEARSYYARLHVGPRSHLVRESMATLADRLDPARFARVHRSVIVNIDRIAELRPDGERGWLVVLRDGRQLPMSRRRRRQLSFLFP